MLKRILVFVAILGGFCLFFGTAYGASFYEGKTMRIIVGSSPGGGFDTYARAISRHIGKFIQGRPTVIVDNMPGAGGLVAAKHMYNVAKPDGLSMASFNGSQIIAQLLGREGVEFDARKFEYIGVPVSSLVVCALSKNSGITNANQWMASKTPVKIGGIAPGNPPDDVPMILHKALGLPIQLVTGYKGTAQIRLATEGGEVSGGCWQWESIKVTWEKAITSGDIVVVIQCTDKPHPELQNVPLALSLAKTEEARQLIQAGIIDSSKITRIFLLPPNVPKERVQMLRKAFQNTMKDPEFLAEANKAKLEVDPLTGEEVEDIIKRLFSLDSDVVSKLKEILYK